MTILDFNLQPIYNALANLWTTLFGNAGEWADNFWTVINRIWDIFQEIFTFVIHTPVA